MSVGHLDYVLTVYSSMEHVTWKSPGPMCGWVGRILHPDSSISLSSWSKVPLLSIWSVAVPLCRPLLSCPSRWHGSLPWHGLWWLTCELHCSPLPWRLGLCTSCERVHFFLVFLDPQIKLPACLSNIWDGVVLARDMTDQFSLLLILDLVGSYQLSHTRDQRRIALRSAPVACATAVEHSLMQRLRPQERSKFYWSTKNIAPVDLVTWHNATIQHGRRYKNVCARGRIAR